MNYCRHVELCIEIAIWLLVSKECNQNCGKNLLKYNWHLHLLKLMYLLLVVCLVDAESSFQTHVKGGPNSDGSYDYGLFQISDRYWCNPGDHPGKGCNVRCNGELPCKLLCKEEKFESHRQRSHWYINDLGYIVVRLGVTVVPFVFRIRFLVWVLRKNLPWRAQMCPGK